jgi:G3E family GTPase
MKIPTTVLGGFLGAGKTTALNALLRHAPHGIAVIVNDFGAINVDAELIETRDGGFMALSNGCVCCSIGSDLSGALARMAALAPPPAQIVIEASGVSDPWRIAQLVKLEPALALDAVIVLVDAENFPSHIADPWLTDTLERQLARADLVRLTKCDVADSARAAETRAAIHRIRPSVPISSPSDGAIPALLLCDHDPGPATRFHTEMPEHNFESWVWRFDLPLHRKRFEAVSADLPSTILRAKGFCRFDMSPDLYVLQLVGRRWTVEPWVRDDQPTGIVFMGKRDFTTSSNLTDRLSSCVHRSLS